MSIPMAAILHGCGQCYQCMIRLRLADNLHGDRHGAIIETDRKSNGRKAKQIDKPCPAAELVKRLGVKGRRARIALRDAWRADRKCWQYNCPGVAKDMAEKIYGNLGA